jgi:hypothetical protein
MNQNQKPESLKLSAREHGVKFLLGETKVKPSDYPTAEWTRTDGNIFSVIATATNAWKKVDPAVANRMRSLTSIAMSGESKDAPEFAAALAQESDNGADGYYVLLGILMEITPNAYAAEDEDEEDDDDCDWEGSDWGDEDEDDEDDC